MNIWKKPWFIPIVLTIIIVVAGQLYTSGKLTKAEALPEQEIRSQLAMIYDGEVKDLMLDGSVYKAKVSRLGAEYAVEVDAGSGKVLSLIQTKESSETDTVVGTGEGEHPPVAEASPNESNKADSDVKEEVDDKADAKADSKTEVPKPNVNKAPEKSKPTKQEKPQKTVLISEQQAMKIGLGQLPAGTIGEVDDVDFVNSSEGGYYLVQIEIDTEDDMDEVTYQIHAISGKVLTVTWDD
ncbi:PepSY domain-containing protein [Sporosarcina luteola]|uniref:PepSY domain-containing protein n=1 Tax=Sporosarcina luteola TaxID=582850 RepID=UPI0020420731|nr:PepSY domain-containing protein [Sporosarcina luteola]MCM3709496.1 PepSY domain-containing protein [Sporosarcina luteola]